MAEQLIEEITQSDQKYQVLLALERDYYMRRVMAR
jgi:hypothetical protein